MAAADSLIGEALVDSPYVEMRKLAYECAALLVMSQFHIGGEWRARRDAAVEKAARILNEA